MDKIKESLSVQEGDRLIHEFDGRGGLSVLLSYHQSWNALMPVIEKIESLSVNGRDEHPLAEDDWDEDDRWRDVEWQFSVVIKNGGCVIDRDVLPQYHGTETDFLGMYNGSSSDKLKSTWRAVVDFIQWYNLSQQTLMIK